MTVPFGTAVSVTLKSRCGVDLCLKRWDANTFEFNVETGEFMDDDDHVCYKCKEKEYEDDGDSEDEDDDHVCVTPWQKRCKENTYLKEGENLFMMEAPNFPFVLGIRVDDESHHYIVSYHDQTEEDMPTFQIDKVGPNRDKTSSVFPRYDLYQDGFYISIMNKRDNPTDCKFWISDGTSDT